MSRTIIDAVVEMLKDERGRLEMLSRSNGKPGAIMMKTRSAEATVKRKNHQSTH
jgi:hypothetical protein